MVPSTKKRQYQNKPGPILPYALMMKVLVLFDSRIKILHQNAIIFIRTSSAFERTHPRPWLQLHICV